mgnify:CR=1 FL=1
MNHKDSTKKFCEIVLDLNLWQTYPDRLKEAYEKLATDNWLSVMNLKNNAEIGCNDYMTTIMMLRGMTIECLLKGLLVSQGNITCKNDELCIPGKYSHHNLISMLEDLKDISINNEDKKVLEKLSYYIVAGRLPRKKVNNGKFIGFWTSFDEDSYKTMLENIEGIFVAHK